MRIRVNASDVIGTQEHFWRGTGFTPAGLLLRPDMHQTLTYLGSIPFGGVTHVRIHFLLDLVKARGLGSATPAYDWSDLDAGVDALVGNGLKPFFELMGNPSGWFSDFNNDAQLHAWRRLVRDLARHLMDRYGRREVQSWYFETWNEPDVGWWHQWPQPVPFCRYYDACSEGLRDANPGIRFGGPGTCKHLSDLLKAVLAHCDSGTNYFTGAKGVRMDFLSVHEKGAWACKEDIAPDNVALARREIALIEYVRRNHPRLAPVPLMNNECDPIVGWGDIHTWHARPYYAALIARVIHQHQVKIIDGMKCSYPILSNDNGFLGTWGNRTQLARLGDPKRVEAGEFELIKKPALNVMALLALLGDRRVAAAGPGDVFEDPVGVMATRRGNDQVAILLYNGCDAIYRSGATEIELEIRGVPFRNGCLAHYRIDERHGDPFAVWEQNGAKTSGIASETLAALRDRQEPETMGPPERLAIGDGVVRMRFSLPLPSVSLVLLSRKPAAAPARVAGLRARIYRGVGDCENVMLSWRGAESRVLRTYEAAFSESPRGPFRRINTPDLICSAFLHARKTRAGTGFYRVRAVDYWGRAGTWSRPLRA